MSSYLLPLYHDAILLRQNLVMKVNQYHITISIYLGKELRRLTKRKRETTQGHYLSENKKKDSVHEIRRQQKNAST